MNHIPKEKIDEVKRLSTQIRKNIIQMLFKAQAGHCGGALSCVEIIATLYFLVLRVNPKNPLWEHRDRFILSKGHGCLALYNVLAEIGFFPKSELETFDEINSILQGHPDMRKTPGIEMSTGSLGQGLSIGVGMALGMKLDNKNCHIYVLLGDGEIQSGQVWEAVMSANHFHLNNLTAIIDRNKLQIVGETEKVMSLEPLKNKLQEFGWKVFEVDGHNVKDIFTAVTEAGKEKIKPSVIIAYTVKGKGISFMENQVEWHSKPMSQIESNNALLELEDE